MARDKFMASTKKETAKKLPSLGFGFKKESAFSGGRARMPKSFVPPTFRITQHKGGGGK